MPRATDATLPLRRSSASESRDDPLLGTTFAGRFTILSCLGRGSMGAVYRARQEAVGRDVAIKIVRPDRAYDPETIARFEREARAVSSLGGPHSVTAFDFGETEDGSWFLVMEMLEGETLGERLKRLGRLHYRDAARFVKHALVSLGEAHEKGIVHRDLKPDNLFLTRVEGSADDVCKILDFGIAKSIGPERGPIDALETQAGTVFGTPRYMSPEQAQGAQLDARSDLYSLGVIFYQMLSGRAPFIDNDAVVVMARHIKDDPPPLRDVALGAGIPPSIERLVERVLAKAPSDRPRNAEEFSQLIDAACEEASGAASGVHLTSVADAPPAKAPARRRKVGFGLLCVTLGALSFFALRSGGERAHRLPAVEPMTQLEPAREPAARGEYAPMSRENSAAAVAADRDRAKLASAPSASGSARSFRSARSLKGAPRSLAPPGGSMR